MNDGSRSFHLQTGLGNVHTSSESTKGTFVQRTKHDQMLKKLSGVEGTFSDILEYSKHLSALKDLEVLKDQYYEQYLNNLEAKVKKQRKTFAENKDAGPCRQEDVVRLQKYKSKLPHHRLKHDSEYMRNVTKSRFYHLLATRDLLQKKGLLKSTSDEEEFWSRVSSDSYVWSQPPPSGVAPDVVTRVMLNRFSSMSTHKKSRRERFVTFTEKGAESPIKEHKESNDKDHDPLTKFKVKMMLPKLHSFTSVILPPIQPKKARIQSSKRKEHYLKKLHAKREAYDVAMINQAMTKKLIHAHEPFRTEEQPHILHEVAAACVDEFESDSMTKFETDKDIKSQVFITEPVYGNDKVLIPDLEYKYVRSNVARIYKKHATPMRNPSDMPPDETTLMAEPKGAEHYLENGDSQPTISTEQTSDLPEGATPHEKYGFLPLSFTMMLEKGALPVKDATSASSVWINYLKDN